jgi:hypothetical protein
VADFHRLPKPRPNGPGGMIAARKLKAMLADFGENVQ